MRVINRRALKRAKMASKIRKGSSANSRNLQNLQFRLKKKKKCSICQCQLPKIIMVLSVESSTLWAVIWDQKVKKYWSVNRERVLLMRY